MPVDERPSSTIVVIGYGTAGSAATAYARLYCKKCRIIVVEKRKYPLYHPCSIPDAIAGNIGFDRLVEQEPLTRGVEFRLGVEAVRIDHQGRQIETSEGEIIEYDKLVYAAGSRPVIPPPFRGLVGREPVYTVRWVEDGQAIRRRALKSESAIVVGAGAIGLEVAVALKRLGLRVHVYELYDRVLPAMLDADFSKRVERILKNMGIELHLAEPVKNADIKNSNVRITTDNTSMEADLLVLATGARPNVELAENAGAKTGALGGLEVSDHMETNLPGFYAAGDVVETRHIVSGAKTLAMLASPAFRQGRVAGINSAGGDERYPGTVLPWIVDLGGTIVGGAGMGAEQASKYGFHVVSSIIHAYLKPPYLDEPSRTLVKLVADADSGRILGVQVLGPSGAVRLVDLAALMLEKRSTINDIIRHEDPYMPKYAEVYSPLFAAAEAIKRRMARS